MLLRELRLLRETDRDVATDAYHAASRLVQQLPSAKPPEHDVQTDFLPMIRKSVARPPISAIDAKAAIGPYVRDAEHAQDLNDALSSALRIATYGQQHIADQVFAVPELQTEILSDPDAGTLSAAGLLSTNLKPTAYKVAVLRASNARGSKLRTAYETEINAALTAEAKNLTAAEMQRGAADGFAGRQASGIAAELASLHDVPAGQRAAAKKAIVQKLETLFGAWGVLQENLRALLAAMPTAADEA